ncbi:extracellular matrix FRAS1 [Micractinium conductrix]|uniref:Extracellular matrix FRAS1 n=1 Tax=Micractinium conductrix TaxID=554055 RepID=A0A2P6V089_9CHLO|nr:extracellular matrix FRAS1 [Micractinium conductrix]|eukprot:PSC67516.1 extracellular matrix FRAS1 [Micractinium conductrix]
MRPAALLLAALLCSVVYGQDTPTCQKLTAKAGCSECRKSTCLYCNANMGMTWKGSGATLQVDKCLAPLSACPASLLSKNPNCKLCVGTAAAPTCIACKTTPVSVAGPPGKTWSIANNLLKLSWATGTNFGKCVGGNKAQISGNSDCDKWNPDGTCTLCKGYASGEATRKYVMPNNAQFTNGVFPMSMCKTKAQLSAISRAAFISDKLAAASFPKQCAEVDTALRCQRCQPNFSLLEKGAKCVANVAGKPKGSNGCALTLPFQQYCEKCNAAGNACTTCVPGRSMAPAGICSLPCKALYGLTCATCNASKCLKNDANFPNGRR